MDFPYEIYRDNKAWCLVEKAIDDLVDNHDIILHTHRDYVVGYLVELLSNADMIDSKSVRCFMYNKQSDQDLFVAIQCMSYLLDTNLCYPGEIHTLIGLDPEPLSNVRNWLQRLLDATVNESELEKRSGLSIDDILLAIHNSIGYVSGGEVFDDDEVKSRYGFTKQELEATYNRWRMLDNSPKFYEHHRSQYLGFINEYLLSQISVDEFIERFQLLWNQDQAEASKECNTLQTRSLELIASFKAGKLPEEEFDMLLDGLYNSQDRTLVDFLDSILDACNRYTAGLYRQSRDEPEEYYYTEDQFRARLEDAVGSYKN